jgi:hypothetical protein
MSSETCYRHPERLAVEHCEVCQKPVCAACLWYAESGERLCPDHAAEFLHAGQTVHPPERYADGILPSQLSAAKPAQPDAPYKGNSTDVTALAAAMAGLMTLLWCGGLSWATPLIAFVLGLVAYLQSRDALDPQRTRRLSLLGLAGGGLLVVAIFAGLALVALCFLLQFALISSSGGPGRFPTPLPLATPLP